MFSVIHKGVCLLCVCLCHWVSYRRNCKGGEWWWQSYCSLFCNFHRKLITYLEDTRCPIILTAESNFSRVFVNSVGIKAAKAKLEKKFYILSLENLLIHICSHCCKHWTARTWPYEPCHFKLLLQVFVAVDLDFANPFEFKVDWATHCQKYHFPHFTCLQVCVVHLEVNPTVGNKFISDKEIFMGSES